MSNKRTTDAALSNMKLIIYRPYNNHTTGYQHIDNMYSLDTPQERLRISLLLNGLAEGEILSPERQQAIIATYKSLDSFTLMVNYFQKLGSRAYRGRIVANHLFDYQKPSTYTDEGFLKLELASLVGPYAQQPIDLVTYEQYQKNLAQMQHAERESQW